MKVQIERAEAKDAEEILETQMLAYQSEAKRYNNYDIPPLKQTVEELRGQFGTHVVLKAVSNGKIVGTVRAHARSGTCYVERLAVHPNMQNRGIGTSLMEQIEKLYDTQRFELFVGSKSDDNIHLYQKQGYHIFVKKSQHECGDIQICYMEKSTVLPTLS